MTDHAFENLAEICGFNAAQLQRMKTYPSEAFVQLLLLKLEEETTHALADLHFGWHLSSAAGRPKRVQRMFAKAMKRELSPIFRGSEWRSRTDEAKTAAMQFAWEELDPVVRTLVQNIFRPNDGEYMVLLGWIVQSTMATRARPGEHPDCACSYPAALAGLGPKHLLARRELREPFDRQSGPHTLKDLDISGFEVNMTDGHVNSRRSTDMTKAQMLAYYLREDEADCHNQDVIYERSAPSAHHVAMLLDVADFLESLPDSDPRITQMDRAHYFDSDVCVPGPKGQSYACWGADRSTEPGQFLDNLAAAARDDEKSWNEGAVPAQDQRSGWNGTTFTHTSEFNVSHGRT